MSTVKHKTFRRQLEALRDRLRPEVSAITEQTLAPAGGQGTSDLSNAPFHLGDTGTDEYLHDLNATLLVNEEYLANEVQAALRRFDEGTFGRCETCGRAIVEARLQALPYTRFCIKCAEASNTAPDVNYNNGRPKNADDTLAPEGEMGEREFDEVDTPFLDGIADENRRRDTGDVHAVGEPGGGTAIGGLAGGNGGHGDPALGELEVAMGSGNFDVTEGRDDEPDEPRSGRAGGAVGGTPANKRSKAK